MDGIRDTFKLSFFEAVSKTGTFDIEKMTEEISQTLPYLDKVLLATRLLIFKDDMDHLMQDRKSVTDKKALANSISEKISSSLDFLLS